MPSVFFCARLIIFFIFVNLVAVILDRLDYNNGNIWHSKLILYLKNATVWFLENLKIVNLYS